MPAICQQWEPQEYFETFEGWTCVKIKFGLTYLELASSVCIAFWDLSILIVSVYIKYLKENLLSVITSYLVSPDLYYYIPKFSSSCPVLSHILRAVPLLRSMADHLSHRLQTYLKQHLNML